MKFNVVKICLILLTSVVLTITIPITKVQAGYDSNVVKIGAPCKFYNPTLETYPRLAKINYNRDHHENIDGGDMLEDQGRSVDIGGSKGIPVTDSGSARPFMSCINDKAIASISGKVRYGYGETLYIDGNNGVTVMYGHLDSYSVDEGSTVSRGEQIGVIGSTGQTGGFKHIHFNVYRGGGRLTYKSKYINRSNQWKFDQDFHDDIIAIGRVGKFHVTESTKQGTYSSLKQLPEIQFPLDSFSLSNQFNQRIFVADYDGDEDEDVLAIGRVGKIHRAESLGNGDYKKYKQLDDEKFPWETYFTTDYNDRVFIGDYDGDSDDDILAIGGSGRINISRSNGTGTFTSVKRLQTIYLPLKDWFGTEYNQRIFVGDYDGDGDDDIVGIGFKGKVSVIESNGDGTFKEKVTQTRIILPAKDWFGTEYNQRVFFEDVDGDGDSDFLAIGIAGKIHVSFADSSGKFGDLQRYNKILLPASDWFQTSYTQRVFMSDYDRDGDYDFVAIGISGRIHLIESNGNGTFKSLERLNDKKLPVNSWFKPKYNQTVFMASFRRYQ